MNRNAFVDLSRLQQATSLLWKLQTVVLGGVLLMCGGLVPAATYAQDGDAAAAAQNATAAEVDPLQEPLSFLRVSDENGETIALEIAITSYASLEGAGPQVALVGVAHISDAAYYKLLQQELDAFEVVLYESVLPPGAAGAGGDTFEQRRSSTQAVLGFLAAQIESYRKQHGELPASLDALHEHLLQLDARQARWLKRARTDGWGHAIVYALDGTNPGYTLKSLGADGEPGGDGEAVDIIAHRDAQVRAHRTAVQEALSGDGDNLQMQLAEALNLAYQLEAIDYDRPHWLCSDMSIDQVQRAMAERGANFDIIGGALAGTSLPAQVVRALLQLIRVADSLLDNAITDTIKVLLIEMLGDESMMQQGFAQLGDGFMEVIINDRNQVVIDDLRVAMQDRAPTDRIAIFYGAGHMPDLHDRLRDQLGYHVADQRWLRAIEVDLSNSAVTQRDLNMIRRMMRSGMMRGR